jgi:hypothetical protein
MSDTPEHTRIVDGACIVYFGKVIEVWLNGYKFTLGEISALAGDFYKNPKDLLDGAGAAYNKLQEYKRKNDSGYKAKPGFDGTCQDTARHHDDLAIVECVKFRKDAFIDLAIKNYAHFVHGKPDENVITECVRHHENALTHVSDWNMLMLHEGFSLHFLVDMFAAGHMRTPRAAIETYLLDGRRMEYRNTYGSSGAGSGASTGTGNGGSSLGTGSGSGHPGAAVGDGTGAGHGENEGAATGSGTGTGGNGAGGGTGWGRGGDGVGSTPRGYEKDNAAVIGSLLSLAQHNHENWIGLRCTWFGPPAEDKDGTDPRPLFHDPQNKWIRNPSAIRSPLIEVYRGMLTGDGSLHAMEYTERADEQHKAVIPPQELADDKPDPRTCDVAPVSRGKNALKHLLGTVAAQLLNAWPTLVADAVPWDKSHLEFLDDVRPHLAETSDGSSDNPIPWMVEEFRGEETLIHWHGPSKVSIFGWIELTVGTNADDTIKHIDIELLPFLKSPETRLLVHGAAARVPIVFPVDASKIVDPAFRGLADYLGPMDGNDPRVSKLFTNMDLMLSGWRALESFEKLHVDAWNMYKKGAIKTGEGIVYGAKKVGGAVQQVGHGIKAGVQQGLEGAEKTLDNLQKQSAGPGFYEVLYRGIQGMGQDPFQGLEN